MGQAEVPGAGANQQIIAYHARTSLSAKSDETPWCASFVSWALEMADMISAHSARAMDYAGWGRELRQPAIGCIVVLRRVGGGHVGFWMGERDGKVLVLGGNQGNRVSIAPYKLDDVVAYRWPSGTPRPEPETLREAAKTGTGRAAAGVAAVTAAAAPAAPLITAMGDLPSWTAAALIAVAAIAVAAWFIAKRVR
jgi:uncharacterized protein (TIGR02594 family)